MKINLEINNIRNIKKADVEFNFEGGIYVIIGENGIGKSTMMLLLSLVVRKSSKLLLYTSDLSEDSSLKLSVDGLVDEWHKGVKRNGDSIFVGKKLPQIDIRGFYEGSVFYGTRFADGEKVVDFLNQENFSEETHLKAVDSKVTQKVSYILKGNLDSYSNLYKVRSKKMAGDFGFSGMPFFRKSEKGDFITQLGMSSGESMIISVIDIIHTNIFYSRKLSDGDSILFIFDEIDLALHPSAVERLKLYFDELIEEYKGIYQINVVFSTHNVELINSVNPNDIFMVSNHDGNISLINPCYPNYGIRSLAKHVGYDFLILVEDNLAKRILENVLSENDLHSSKLIYVLPSGGFNQILKLNRDLLKNGVLSQSTKTICVFDGDVKGIVEQDNLFRKGMPHTFLPIASVEKHLKYMLVDNPDSEYIKILGDRFFRYESLNSIIDQYCLQRQINNHEDKTGKTLYKKLINILQELSVSEEMLIDGIADIIRNYEPLKKDMQEFESTISKLIR